MLYPVTELLNARFAAVFDSVIFPIALSDIYRNFVFFRLAIVYTDFFYTPLSCYERTCPVYFCNYTLLVVFCILDNCRYPVRLPSVVLFYPVATVR